MWQVYILRLSDDSLYTGITKDLDRRMRQHKNGNGSKYVKGRLPFELVYTEERDDRTDAMRRESEIKNYSRERKERLIED